MNKELKNLLRLFSLALLAPHQLIQAVDFHIGGFGTAGFSCFTNNSADYVINDQPEGPGRSRQCDGGTDSNLGIQIDLELLESLEIGVQAVADRNEDRDYLPGLMVAQLRWHLADNLTFRIGRTPTPLFIYSESRQVRYALPWVRPPLEVYGLLPTFAQNAVEFLYNNQIGDWQAEWHGGVSQIEFDTPLSNTKDTFPVKAYGGFLTVTLEQSNTLIKLGYGYNETSFSTPDIDFLLNALRSPLIPEGSRLADELLMKDAPTHLVTIGMRYEYEDWLTMAEFGYRTIESFFRDQYGAYITVGHRFNSWLPYLTVAKRWTSGPDNDDRASFLQPQTAALLASTRYDSASVALGVSHDVNDYIKVKLQTDWIRPDSNSWGLFTNHAPDYDYSDPGSDWLFSMNLDFVF